MNEPWPLLINFHKSRQFKHESPHLNIYQAPLNSIKNRQPDDDTVPTLRCPKLSKPPLNFAGKVVISDWQTSYLTPGRIPEFVGLLGAPSPIGRPKPLKGRALCAPRTLLGGTPGSSSSSPSPLPIPPIPIFLFRIFRFIFQSYASSSTSSTFLLRFPGNVFKLWFSFAGPCDAWFFLSDQMNPPFF